MDQLEAMLSMDETNIPSISELTQNQETVAVAEEIPSQPVTPEIAAAIAEPAVAEAVEETTPQAPETQVQQDPNLEMIPVGDVVTVSSVILGNIDKHVKCKVINHLVASADNTTDVTNYIVYINTDKKIPCVYDCTNLYLKKSDVTDANGVSTVQSIEGRRSGFIIRCTGMDFVMTKNFIYKCVFDANGYITAVYEYSRMRKNGVPSYHMYTDVPTTDNFESAIIYTQEFLKKVPKKLQDKTIEGLRTEVIKQYSAVDDINAMINIIKLRHEIGC